MNYSLFLFSKLYDVFVGVNYEYDLLFADLQLLYVEFEASKYNEPNAGEYECMVDFFQNNRTAILDEFIKKSK